MQASCIMGRTEAEGVRWQGAERYVMASEGGNDTEVQNVT
jgi:hypothetical protein